MDLFHIITLLATIFIIKLFHFYFKSGFYQKYICCFLVIITMYLHMKIVRTKNRRKSTSQFTPVSITTNAD